jgi:hypothetical protein
MVLWFTILVGIIAAWLGREMRFYSAWALLFNILVSMYLGVMLTPVLIGVITDQSVSYYHCATGVAGIAIIAFIILHTFTAIFLTADVEIRFPRMFDGVGSAILAFLSGYLVCNFVILVICIMPFTKNSTVENIIKQAKLTSVAVPSVAVACDFVGTMSMQCYGDAAERVVGELPAPGYDSEYDPRKITRTRQDEPYGDETYEGSMYEDQSYDYDTGETGYR